MKLARRNYLLGQLNLTRMYRFSKILIKEPNQAQFCNRVQMCLVIKHKNSFSQILDKV